MLTRDGWNRVQLMFLALVGCHGSAYSQTRVLFVELAALVGSENGWHGHVLVPMFARTSKDTGMSTCPCHP